MIGVDEVGCGCLAGPVVAAAIHLPLNSRIAEIHDSKLLRPEKRRALFEIFLERDISFSIGMASVAEVDTLNVRKASLLAMKRAIEAFPNATFALIDAWNIPGLALPHRGIIHGDRLVKSIAAASIVAKVVRDFMMMEYEDEFPGYGFARHKGYGTALHQKMLKKLGPSLLHRKAFIKNVI